ncbi:hypothetical protein AOCH_001814 [Aspergillus ochraceoroseus]|uniref:Anticodon-binding domain-containing protein n=1 Tax=Aspergillus ochraceoroseus TaxID=138278 RepID=A0A0F8U1B8_9EURO|nr:hypothetical protein AOCH_001814 [Aspergillus ochraceoroseus]
MATLNTKAGQVVDRTVLDSMLRRRLFYTPAFEIYGGVSGLYDYGPPGCAVLNHIVDLWRKHFVLEEDMLEVDCTMLTPHEILKTSGHVDKFADWMCKDPKTGEIFRADHLVEEVLEARLKGDKEARGQKVVIDEEKEAKKKKKAKSQAIKLDDALVKEYEEVLAQIDNFDGPALEQLIAKYDIRNPTTDGNLLPPVAFNLMFQTSIGPSSNMPGYLRPETAQGQFLNFQKLLDFNQQAMPFASASIGKSFRNEISPRAGLLRVRGKKHARFEEVKDTEMTLLNRDIQLSGSTKTEVMTIGKAVEIGLVNNETLGYFLARIQMFLLKLGIDPSKLRFRQHMANEMAHYAADCWDAELHTSYGWIECVGCADRSAYDLTVHKNKTGAPLVVRETRAEPLKVEEWQIDLDKKKFGPRFKKDGKTVEAAIEALSQELREKLALDLEQSGKIEVEVEGVAFGKVELDKELIKIEKRTRVENVREYTPNVIEPSFGIGRILYSMIEHVYWYREGDEARGVLSFPPLIAPTKVLLVPLSSNPVFRPLTQRLMSSLRRMGISNRVDDTSASIGKRYARNDELGTPFGVTVDFQSVKDETFTLRDRDSTKQVRASEAEILQALKSLVEGEETWEDIRKRLPEFTGQESQVNQPPPVGFNTFPPPSLSCFFPSLRQISLFIIFGRATTVPKMAPNISSAKLTLSCPLFAADFDPRNPAFLLVAGGGGEGRSGALLNASKRHELSELVDIELSRDEDSVTSLATAHANDNSIVALAGRTTALSRTSLFRSKAGGGANQSTDTYQRILRLSPWKDDESPRVAAIATGLAPSGEIVFFSAYSPTPGESDVIGRIRLNGDEEAEDIDIIAQDDEEGKFAVAYTNGTEVFTCRISSETRSNAAPDVTCVYTPTTTKGTTTPTSKGSRPKFRALRFLSPTTLLLLQNAPDRKGCELVLLDLRPATSSSSTTSSAQVVHRHKLRKSIKIGLGLDVSNLGKNLENQQQSIIAVSGSDQSIEVLTIDFDPRRLQRTGAGYTSFRPYTTLREVHPFSMTKICFSHFLPPPHPVAAETPPQSVKLASVSMGNTVVVHTFALSPIPPSSRTPRYVLVIPGESELWTNAFSAVASLLSIIFVIFLVQAFTEIRGVMPPYLGITKYLPPDIREAIARPYDHHITPPLFPLQQEQEAEQQQQQQQQQQAMSASDSASFSAGSQHRPLLRDIIPDSPGSLFITCNPSTNEILVESTTTSTTSNEQAGPDSPPKHRWADLSPSSRSTWKQSLSKAGLLEPQSNNNAAAASSEDESILQNILFGESCFFSEEPRGKTITVV